MYNLSERTIHFKFQKNKKNKTNMTDHLQNYMLENIP